MILTVTLNPSVDRTLYVEALQFADTNRVIRTETDAGGKGVNLARIATELGAEAMALGFLGGGPGAFVRSVLDREGVKNNFLEIGGDTRLNISVELDDGSLPATTFNEPGPRITSDHWEAITSLVRSFAAKSSFTCIGGSIPPGLDAGALRALGELCVESGSKFVLDADGDALKLGLLAKPHMVKPNAKEAERLLITPVRTKQQCMDAARELYAREIPIVVISRGAAGAVMLCSEGAFEGLPPQIKSRSTIGSGDSMVGAMVWALDSGKSIVEAFAWGIAAGAATATTSGAEIARRPVIEELLSQVRIHKHGA
jgi:1-phosphofructokinase family hexose kinase